MRTQVPTQAAMLWADSARPGREHRVRRPVPARAASSEAPAAEADSAELLAAEASVVVEAAAETSAASIPLSRTEQWPGTATTPSSMLSHFRYRVSRRASLPTAP